MLRDFGQCVDASEERQIVQRDPPQHEASRLQPARAARQGHFDFGQATYPPLLHHSPGDDLFDFVNE
jgi:hypothetical protein